MNAQQAIESLRLKFTSGNSVPVTRSQITREEFDALSALQLAHGQEAVAQDAAMFAWLAKYPNFYTVCDLLRADQYVTLRRACEALMPLDTATAGEVGNG